MWYNINQCDGHTHILIYTHLKSQKENKEELGQNKHFTRGMTFKCDEKHQVTDPRISIYIQQDKLNHTRLSLSHLSMS